MPGFVRIVRAQTTSAGELLNAGMKHAGEEAVLESLMEVTHRPQFGLDPTFLDAILEGLQRLKRKIVFHHAVEGSLRRQHSALDRQMNPFEPLRIQESGGVSEHHPAVARERRNAPPTPVRQGLRAVADHLSILQQLGDEGVLLKFLQHALRVEARIAVVESSDETE